MGSSNFKPAKPGSTTPKSYNLEARALGAPGYTGHGDMMAAQKDLGAAAALNKSAVGKKLTGTSAYPKGPKV
jgi:hypothetical protein